VTTENTNRSYIKEEKGFKTPGLKKKLNSWIQKPKAYKRILKRKGNELHNKQ
jgi:hypothetical protein